MLHNDNNNNNNNNNNVFIYNENRAKVHNEIKETKDV